jgi:hypothetical protein
MLSMMMGAWLCKQQGNAIALSADTDRAVAHRRKLGNSRKSGVRREETITCASLSDCWWPLAAFCF